MAPRSSSEYVVLSHVEHVRLRPDTYLGRTTPETARVYVADSLNSIRLQTVPDFVPGLYKIFDEVLVNCIDQSKMDASLTKIKVSIDQAAGKVTVYNDGRGIPVEKHPSMTDCFTPEVIFGVLLSGSNYDDTKERVVGGRNGLGVKLTNIFSTSFELEVADDERGLKFVQKWSKMQRKGEPKVTRMRETHSGTSYVKVTFVPDLAYFGVESLSDALLAFFHKRVLDAAACTPDRVGVYLDGKKVGVKSFNDYVSMYIGRPSVTARVEIDAGPHWKVVLARAPEKDDGNEYRSGDLQVSFVNGVLTVGGGTHVEHVMNLFIKQALIILDAKAGSGVAAALRSAVLLFVDATLVNPTFDSQTKVRRRAAVSLLRLGHAVMLASTLRSGARS